MTTPPPQPGEGNPGPADKPIDKQVDDLLNKIEEADPGAIDPEMLEGSFMAPAEAVQAEADEIDALLNAPPAEAAAITPEPAPTASGAESTEPALSMEEQLQQEISALMEAEPQAEADAAGATEAFAEIDDIEGSFEGPQAQATAGPTTSTEDQIAMEIEGLLNTGPAEPASNTADETAIDELDKMLAQEIDEDDDLAGDFQSVEDLTAGIQVGDTSGPTDDDEHAATARDVAAELDSQPEDAPPLPQPEPAMAAVEPGEDPFAVLAEIAETAEKNEEEHQRRVAMEMPDWQRWFNTFKEQSLNICFAINWPARRFLNNEWRATLGLISLTVAGSSSLFLIAVLLFG